MNELKDSIAVVTGVTRGIGRAVALGLARRGVRLRVIGRSHEAFEALANDVRAFAPNHDLRFYRADLALVSETRRALRDLAADDESVDMLYQSAGLLPSRVELTSEGIERTLAVSFLTRFIIAMELVPAMAARGRGLFLNMAGAGQRGTVVFDDPNFTTTPFRPIAVVKQFQQANDALVVELAARYGASGVRVHCLNPGLVNTEIHQAWPPLLRALMNGVLRPLVMKSPERAARIPLSIVDGVSAVQGPLVGSTGRSIATGRRLEDASYRQRVLAMADELVARARSPQLG
ncbi:MAG: SDR family NAD(P)-dependent oxidoreductase [Myxococcota bacterium]